MLAITMALLGGASFMALLSVRNGAVTVGDNAQRQALQAGVLLNVVGTQTNSSGTYVWLFDYGWEGPPVSSVHLGAQEVQWSTTCGGRWAGSLCVVKVPGSITGVLTVIVGGVSIEAAV